MADVILDSCVVVDMFMSTRPRHAKAKRLRIELSKSGARALFPIFALFEINHAIRQEQRLSGGKLVQGEDLGEANGLFGQFVPIDEAFVKKYLDVNLPELRAGDLVFAALAKGEGLPLITEDAPFAKAAHSAGIRVFTIDQYLAELSADAA